MIKFPVSPSMLGTFDTCPRQFKAKYITKEVVFQQNPHAEFGQAVHKNIENYLTRGMRLHPSLARLKPVLDRMTENTTHAERKLGMYRSHKPADYWDKSCWVRCQIDFTVYLNPETILVLDWKTGKEKDDWIQQDLTKLVTASHHPEVTTIYSGFSYLFKGGTPIETFHPGKEKPIGLYALIAKLDNAVDTDNFPPKPSGLCGKWCDVLSCEHNGRR